MNSKTPEPNKIPLLIRSDQWTIAEKTKNQVSAVRIKNKQDDMIVQQNQKIDSQNKLINQLNQMIDQQNKKIDDLNTLLNRHINTEPQYRIETQDKIKQNVNTEKTGNRLPIQNDTVKSLSSSSSTAILMADSKEKSDATVFDSSIKRSEVSAIYTRNTLEDIPSSAWDVSAARDGSVMAWTQVSSDEKTHILYLAANGDIYANPNCSYIFANYEQLATADFSHLKTDRVTHMGNMFKNCKQLASIDVSSWDVSNVMYMNSMFDCCIRLASIDVSNWNVSNVTDMSCMFCRCDQLASIDVSNWNVSNVIKSKNIPIMSILR